MPPTTASTPVRPPNSSMEPWNFTPVRAVRQPFMYKDVRCQRSSIRNPPSAPSF
jgi:hypothetical protein